MKNASGAGNPDVYAGQTANLVSGSVCRKNDHEAVRRAGESGHKEINRTNLSTDQITEGLKKDVVQKQLALIRMRNTHKAFSEGAEVAISGGERSLEIRWEYNSAFATLYVNFESGTYTIVESR